ncbi:unnamed protein product [Owenia fusiformis]|uniref:Sulfotransferase domain-containing protein n=1 Tax=Owenia fusiformis TaxID=6347 RepID=A0A8S4Q241_OWEFU|nr:unnamed protein product [Owenia fusiformis]
MRIGTGSTKSNGPSTWSRHSLKYYMSNNIVVGILKKICLSILIILGLYWVIITIRTEVLVDDRGYTLDSVSRDTGSDVDSDGDKGKGYGIMSPCRPVGLSDDPLPITALSSSPGSGNTWTRFLIQQLTGIATGSVYKASWMKQAGYPGEGLTNGSVVVVKTHMLPYKKFQFDKAVLILRNVKSAMIAEQKRRHYWSFNRGSREMFKDEDWERFTMIYGDDWLNHNTEWIQISEPLYIVLYDNLMNDLKSELRKLAQYLGFTADESLLDCIHNHKNSLKKKKNMTELYPFNKETELRLDGYLEEICQALQTRYNDFDCTPLYAF